MKKFISAFIAAATITSLIPSVTTVASDNNYVPMLYFRANEAENVNVIFDNLVSISPDAFNDGDFSLNISVYIKDENQCIDAISAKWKSNSEYITLENLTNPTVSTGESKTYTTSDGRSFTTDLTPFCYGVIEDDGTMDIPYTLTALIRDTDQIMAFTYEHISFSQLAPFDFLGMSSDEYQFTSFDAVINSQTPDGVHEIIFTTKENTGNDSAAISHGHAVVTNTQFYSFHPSTLDLNIVTGYFKLGDIDENGTIDALDASMALTAYAKTATNQDSGLTKKQTLAADPDNSGAVNAIDASEILTYYAYTATGGKSDFQEFLKQN